MNLINEFPSERSRLFTSSNRSFLKDEFSPPKQSRFTARPEKDINLMSNYLFKLNSPSKKESSLGLGSTRMSFGMSTNQSDKIRELESKLVAENIANDLFKLGNRTYS